jgi:uncharacterized protein (TIGR02246 family)
MTPQELMVAYERATAAHDLPATVELIAPDALYWFSDGTVHDGRVAIESVLAQNFALISDETYRIEDLRWLAQSAAVAVCVYRFVWTGSIDGVRTGGEGRGTSVVERRDETWLVVHEHLSSI